MDCIFSVPLLYPRTEEVEPFIQPFPSWKTGHANMSVCLSVDTLGLHKSLSLAVPPPPLLLKILGAMAKISVKHRQREGTSVETNVISLLVTLSPFPFSFIKSLEKCVPVYPSYVVWMLPSSNHHHQQQHHDIQSIWYVFYCCINTKF